LILEQGVPKNIRQLTVYAWFDGCQKNQLLVVVKLLKSNSNFKEGLSILEYFFLLTVLVKVLRMENSGCRIPTRRLHDVSQELLTLKIVEH
jgi:hypothetical protein